MSDEAAIALTQAIKELAAAIRLMPHDIAIRPAFSGAAGGGGGVSVLSGTSGGGAA